MHNLRKEFKLRVVGRIAISKRCCIPNVLYTKLKDEKLQHFFVVAIAAAPEIESVRLHMIQS